jgi:3-hydroxymyristoyl/3-hydroxydecanoyl-(acyl carrier protein) dehydratase
MRVFFFYLEKKISQEEFTFQCHFPPGCLDLKEESFFPGLALLKSLLSE